MKKLSLLLMLIFYAGSTHTKPTKSAAPAVKFAATNSGGTAHYAYQHCTNPSSYCNTCNNCSVSSTGLLACSCANDYDGTFASVNIQLPHPSDANSKGLSNAHSKGLYTDINIVNCNGILASGSC